MFVLGLAYAPRRALLKPIWLPPKKSTFDEAIYGSPALVFLGADGQAQPLLQGARDAAADGMGKPSGGQVLKR